MLDSGSSRTTLNPSGHTYGIVILLMINEVGIVMPHTNNPQRS